MEVLSVTKKGRTHSTCERNKNSCIVTFCALLRLLGVVSARFFSFLERVEETTLPPRVSYWPGATSHQPFFPTTLLAKKAIHLLPVSTNTCDYYCAFSSNTCEEIEAIGWLTNFDTLLGLSIKQNLYFKINGNIMG